VQRARSRRRRASLLDGILALSARLNIETESVIAGSVLLCALVLGGAAQPEIIGNTLLSAIAIVAFAVLVPKYLSQHARESSRLPVVFFALLLLVPLLQLIPLPGFLWQLLPGRSIFSSLTSILPDYNFSTTWTVSPAGTWDALGFMFVPVAVFLATALTSSKNRTSLVVLLVAVAFFSMLLGLMQLAGGEQSPLRIYANTNKNSAVGFFANRNHFGALLYCALPFAFSALFLLVPDALSRRSKRNKNTPASILPLSAAVAGVILLIFGAGLSASRAAIALISVATFFLLSMEVLKLRRHFRSSGIIVATLTIFAALLLVTFYFLDTLAARFTAKDIYFSRAEFSTVTWNAITTFFPFGSGAGTFEPIYRWFENFETAGVPAVNHAHNDYLEWLLEAGIFAVVLIGLAVVWFSTRALHIWFAGNTGFSDRDLMLARAASIVPVMLAIHSVVDYPLRTGALASVFAFCCALMCPPPPGREAE
jgi:O-antigen ligase